jgi:hypothetical protein
VVVVVPSTRLGSSKDKLVTALHRVVSYRRIGVGHVGVLTWSGPEVASLRRLSGAVSRYRVLYEVTPNYQTFLLGLLTNDGVAPERDLILRTTNGVCNKLKTHIPVS